MTSNIFHICKIQKGPIAIIFNEEHHKIERKIFDGTLKECKNFIEENYGVVKTLGSIKKELYTEGISKVQ